MKRRAQDSDLKIGSAEELLLEFAAQTAECVKLVDLDGRVLSWNAACEMEFGWSAEQAMGQELPHVPEQMRRRTVADLRTIAASGRVTEREAELQRADGSRFLARLVAIPVSDQDGDASGVLSIVTEAISDRRLERQRETLADMVARHLKAPLSDVLTTAQMLQRPEIGSDTARRAEVTRLLTASATRALRFVDDLTTLAAIERGELVLEKELVDLSAVVNATIAQVEGAPARVQLDFDPALPMCPVDARRLSGAVVLLLEAALRVTPASRGVGVSVFRERRWAVIEVRDRGPALSSDAEAQLFSSFYTGSDPRGESGARMGMYVVRGIVEAHAGHVSIAPAGRGQGAVARVRLPLT